MAKEAEAGMRRRDELTEGQTDRCPACNGTRDDRRRIGPLGSWCECVNVFHSIPQPNLLGD